MMNIHLSEDENRILDETLDVSLSRLYDEIMHTDAHEYREHLKERRETLLKIREKLH